MDTTETVHRTPEPSIAEQVPRLLAHVAGYVGHRTVCVGLRQGLVEELARSEVAVPADELADRLQLDPFYVAVWCRAAVACGLCDRDRDRDPSTTDGDGAGLDGRYRLAPHVATLLLDTDHPAYVGGVFTVLEQPEVFEGFEQNLRTGKRLWWDAFSPDWIAGVAATGTPFYLRLVPGGLERIPGLAERLRSGCRVVDTACGSGAGVVRLATTYPHCQIVGVDGDEHSLEQARRAAREAGIAERCEFVCSPLEELVLRRRADCVINNISMHECRDIDRVTANVHAALEPGGWFVISDFPFPDTVERLRTVPGRVMSGIQYFEAQIDDQLLPRSAYDDLLARHGFTELGNVELGAVHAVTYGRRPG